MKHGSKTASFDSTGAPIGYSANLINLLPGVKKVLPLLGKSPIAVPF